MLGNILRVMVIEMHEKCKSCEHKSLDPEDYPCKQCVYNYTIRESKWEPSTSMNEQEEKMIGEALNPLCQCGHPELLHMEDGSCYHCDCMSFRSVTRTDMDKVHDIEIKSLNEITKLCESDKGTDDSKEETQ